MHPDVGDQMDRPRDFRAIILTPLAFLHFRASWASQSALVRRPECCNESTAPHLVRPAGRWPLEDRCRKGFIDAFNIR